MDNFYVIVVVFSQIDLFELPTEQQWLDYLMEKNMTRRSILIFFFRPEINQSTTSIWGHHIK